MVNKDLIQKIISMSSKAILILSGCFILIFQSWLNLHWPQTIFYSGLCFGVAIIWRCLELVELKIKETSKKSKGQHKLKVLSSLELTEDEKKFIKDKIVEDFK